MSHCSCRLLHSFPTRSLFTLLTQRRSPLSITGNLSYLLMINGQICHTTTCVHSSTFKHSLRTAYTSSALYPKSFVLLSGVINGVWGTVWSLQNFLGEFDYSQRIKKKKHICTHQRHLHLSTFEVENLIFTFFWYSHLQELIKRTPYTTPQGRHICLWSRGFLEKEFPITSRS